MWLTEIAMPLLHNGFTKRPDLDVRLKDQDHVQMRDPGILIFRAHPAEPQRLIKPQRMCLRPKLDLSHLHRFAADGTRLAD